MGLLDADADVVDVDRMPDGSPLALVETPHGVVAFWTTLGALRDALRSRPHALATVQHCFRDVLPS